MGHLPIVPAFALCPHPPPPPPSNPREKLSCILSTNSVRFPKANHEKQEARRAGSGRRRRRGKQGVRGGNRGPSPLSFFILIILSSSSLSLACHFSPFFLSPLHQQHLISLILLYLSPLIYTLHTCAIFSIQAFNSRPSHPVIHDDDSIPLLVAGGAVA